jgi:hypothetical protein
LFFKLCNLESKIHLEKSKTVIVNVTPQQQETKSNELDEETGVVGEAVTNSQIQSDAHLNYKYPTSNMVSNLKKLMDFKSAPTTIGSAGQDSNVTGYAPKDLYGDESKYDMKNDSTPVSITSNINKPKAVTTFASNGIDKMPESQIDQNCFNMNDNDSKTQYAKANVLRNSKTNNVNSDRIDLNQNVFPTQSSSYYNDVNNRFHMSTSQDAGVDGDVFNGANSKRLSSGSGEIALNYHDETKASSSNQSYSRNPFHENQTSQLEANASNNVAMLTHPVSTFYNGSKVWTTVITKDGYVFRAIIKKNIL